MHTVELLEQAIAAAERLGYGIRYESLGGAGGGACEFGGRKWIFIDLSQSNLEQLDQLVAVLRQDAGIHAARLSSPLSKLVFQPTRRAA